MKISHHTLAQVSTRPSNPQTLALQTQERDFVQRVTGTKPIIEFEAIDDADRVSQPDVFGAQITVSVNDVPTQHATNQEVATLR